jgi:hypothetical protein
LYFNSFIGGSVAKTTVYWQGGKNNCTSCGQNNGDPSNSYACDYNGDGLWNKGQQVFRDPIPSSQFLAVQISLKIGGRFNCKNLNTATSITFQVGDGIVENVVTPIVKK